VHGTPAPAEAPPRPRRRARRRQKVTDRVVGVYRSEPKERDVDVGGLGDNAKDALNSGQGEQRSDQALDKVEQFADDKPGGKYDQQTDKVGDMADQRIGQQDPGQSGA
jgi:hypothetical protein